MSTGNYTVEPEGKLMDGGIIQVCPRCGQKGLAKVEDGGLFYTHQQGGWPDEKGFLNVGALLCRPEPHA